MGIFLRLFTRPSNRPTIIEQREEKSNNISNNNENSNFKLNNFKRLRNYYNDAFKWKLLQTQIASGS